MGIKNNLSLTKKNGIYVRQAFFFGLVGLVSNFAGFAVYLLLTYFGGTPKVTMTILYGVGATVGFYGNKNLTFKHKGNTLGAGIRYIIVHCFGYLINLAILIIFVDRWGYSHQYVQAIAIFIVAAFLFLVFKVFVFPLENDTVTEGR